MTNVNFYIVQENAKKERRHQFLFKDEVEYIYLGFEAEFKKKKYKVIKLNTSTEIVEAYCYEIKKPKHTS